MEKFSSRITSCQVTVIGPAKHHRHRVPFKIDVRIAMPNRKEIVVNGTHDDVKQNEYVTAAIKDAFAAAQRRVEDAVREMRSDVKPHEAEDHGRVTKFLAGQDYGFIEGFDRLKVGTEVRFVAEIGEKGVQTTTVCVICKHHLQ